MLSIHCLLLSAVEARLLLIDSNVRNSGRAQEDCCCCAAGGAGAEVLAIFRSSMLLVPVEAVSFPFCSAEAPPQRQASRFLSFPP